MSEQREEPPISMDQTRPDPVERMEYDKLEHVKLGHIDKLHKGGSWKANRIVHHGIAAQLTSTSRRLYTPHTRQFESYGTSRQRTGCKRDVQHRSSSDQLNLVISGTSGNKSFTTLPSQK
ncbi:hypothetical protein WG66_016240 [Moniliophthora roreri]|nr:hypothetical protein WG66_016240 [Moniliophthora roreri]